MPAIKITKQQRDLIIRLVISAIIVISIGAFSLYLKGFVEDLDKKHTWLKNDIGELSRKLIGLNQKTLEFSEAVKTWENLSEEDKKLEGLRINDAKDMLENLQKKYKLGNVKTSFSKPNDLGGTYKTEVINVIASSINMNFTAASDEYVFNIINDLTTNFPGFVQIKSFSINKSGVVSKEIIKKIAAGEDVALVTVSLDFFWLDLKYKAPTEHKPAITTQEGGSTAQ